MRQAWHWLGRWHDPLSVGATVALVGLVYLMPVGTGAMSLLSADQPHSAATLASQRTPVDAQYYREQWIREAAQFYALHPPQRDQSATSRNQTPAVTTAKASFVQSPAAASAVKQAAHITATSPPRPAAPVVKSAAPAPKLAATTTGPADWIGRWRIAASLTAGLLAGLAFVIVWPASALGGTPARSQNSSLPPELLAEDSAADPSPLAAETGAGEVIAIRLPAAWVGVRPTTSETLRRMILAASYLIASLCGWSLLG